MSFHDRLKRYRGLAEDQRAFLSRQRSGTQVAVTLICVIPVAAGSCAITGLLVYVVEVACRAIPGAARWVEEHVHIAVFALMLYAAFTVIFLLAMRLVAKRLAELAGMREMARTTCPGCGYSLCGLTTKGHLLPCPECGHLINTYLYDIRAEDLLRSALDEHSKG